MTINNPDLESNGGVKLSLDMGVYDVLKRVQEKTDLCNYGTMLSLSGDELNGNSCPSAGYYHLYSYFSLPNLFTDHDMQYTPDIRVKFFSGDGEDTILGCASTGTIAHYKSGTTHSQNGQIALGISMAVFTFCFGCMLCATYRRKKRLELERAEQMTVAESHYGYVRSSNSGHVMRLDADGQLH